MEAKGDRKSTRTVVLSTFKMMVKAVGLKEVYDSDDVREFLASKNRQGVKGTTRHNYYRFLKIVFERMEWNWDLKVKEAVHADLLRRLRDREDLLTTSILFRFWYRIHVHCRNKPAYPDHETWEAIESYMESVGHH